MSSGFVSEKTLEEKKKARQDEWDKVRKPEDPEEAPEEAPIWDGRSLYDQLQVRGILQYCQGLPSSSFNFRARKMLSKRNGMRPINSKIRFVGSTMTRPTS